MVVNFYKLLPITDVVVNYKRRINYGKGDHPQS